MNWMQRSVGWRGDTKSGIGQAGCWVRGGVCVCVECKVNGRASDGVNELRQRDNDDNEATVRHVMSM